MSETARDLNEVGLRCPDCSARLVYADVHEYRCTGKKCGGLYAFSLCAVEGIVLTPKEGLFKTRRKDALPTAEQLTDRRPDSTPKLELVHLQASAQMGAVAEEQS